MTSCDYDTIVVGAGLHGLAYARAHLRLSPEASIAVLDSSRSIGGVWAEERLYPNLRTNNLIGTYEFTDFPILDAGLDPKHGLRKGVHAPGAAVHDYLQKFAEREGIAQHVRLGVEVVGADEVALADGRLGWRVRTRSADEATELTCARLAVCTGVCSQPAPILIPGADSFDRPCLSFQAARQRVAGLCADPAVQHATVYGAGKAAYDVVYALAAAGRRVAWVIRKSGTGAQWMANPVASLGPLHIWLEGLVLARWVTWFSPCIFGDEDGFGGVRRWLQTSRAGLWCTRAFWSGMSSFVLHQTGLGDGAAGCKECLRPLVPRTPLLWHGTQSGVLNFDSDIKDYVRSGQVVAQVRDVARLAPGGTVEFTDGTSQRTDAFFAVTGWRYVSPIAFRPAQTTVAALGIPTAAHTADEAALWAALDGRADALILDRLPLLRESALARDPPVPSAVATEAALSPSGKPASPWRLYRGIAPPGQATGGGKTRNLVVLGAVQTSHGNLRAELCALWAWAYLRHELAREPGSKAAMAAQGERDVAGADAEEAVFFSAAVFQRFSAWRHPLGSGRTTPELLVDSMPYYDLLLNDLGVQRWRVGGGRWFGWLREVFNGMVEYKRYAGCLDEFKERTRSEAGRASKID